MAKLVVAMATATMVAAATKVATWVDSEQWAVREDNTAAMAALVALLAVGMATGTEEAAMAKEARVVATAVVDMEEAATAAAVGVGAVQAASVAMVGSASTRRARQL